MSNKRRVAMHTVIETSKGLNMNILYLFLRKLPKRKPPNVSPIPKKRELPNASIIFISSFILNFNNKLSNPAGNSQYQSSGEE